MSEVKPIRGRFTQMLEDERAPTSHERAPTSHEKTGFPKPGLRPNVSPKKYWDLVRIIWEVLRLKIEHLDFLLGPDLYPDGTSCKLSGWQVINDQHRWRPLRGGNEE